MGYSYSNSGGTGDRTGSITVTSTAANFSTSVPANLVNGSVVDSVAGSWAFNAAESGREIKFDFGSARTIRQARWYQGGTGTHGTWKWRGSNDDSSYTDIGSAFTLGGSSVIPQIHVELINNTTAYRYYKLVQQSGTTSAAPWLREIEFFIDGATDEEGDTSYVYPAGGGANQNGVNSGTGGSGVDRNTGSVVIPTFSFSPPDGTASNLVDGATANNSTDSTDFPAALTTGIIKFQFAIAQRIDEMTWEQNTASTHGNWDFEGSNDDSNWTSIRANFTFGGSSQVTTFTNTTAYLYYRIKQVSGTANTGPWLHEAYFKTVPHTKSDALEIAASNASMGINVAATVESTLAASASIGLEAAVTVTLRKTGTIVIVCC